MPITERILEAAIQTPIAEWIAVACGIAYLIFASRQHNACWIFGLLSSAIYVYLCFDARLYLDSILQVFYVIMAVYGWIAWNRGKISTKPVTTWPIEYHGYALALALSLTLASGYFFDQFTDQANAYFDAAITISSIIATFMTAHKILETWLYWIIIDASAILLYGYRELYLTSLLYFIFTIMAAYAWYTWYNAKKKTDGNQHLELLDA